MSESRKILVTGANGFVGDRVTRRLVAAGHEVRALVRRAGTAPDLGAAGREIVGDFTDEATAIAAADGVDAIVHCAATVGPDLESARHVNVTGTQSMLTAAERAAVRRFVHISTISVYELEGHARVDENSPYKTEGNAYGVSKAEGDELVLPARADRYQGALDVVSEGGFIKRGATVEVVLIEGHRVVVAEVPPMTAPDPTPPPPPTPAPSDAPEGAA